jgi:hypothetical protein
MTQTNQIIEYLKPFGRTITPMQALKKFGCWALSSRMSDIRKMGYKVHSEMVSDKKTKKYYAKYSLV